MKIQLSALHISLMFLQSFGEKTEAIITLNLPKPEGGGIDFSTVVTSCLCLSLFFTYPIMMFPVTSIIDGKLEVTAENPQKIKTVSFIAFYFFCAQVVSVTSA